MVVVVVVVVRSLTGTVGSPSTAGLTVIAAAALVGARLDQVVADEQLQLGGERGVVLTKVAERGAEAGFVGHAAIVGPREPRGGLTRCALRSPAALRSSLGSRAVAATVAGWAPRSARSACSTRSGARSRLAS